MTEYIRNFCIISHVDHGKSTLADRLLELTGAIEPRKMKEQVLDSMDLERERGITIKMQPVRMEYELRGKSYKLNLIDTPGHIDFSYEVSRALDAVEGAILLVDATQGIQAQTLTTLYKASELGLTILGVVTKIDSPLARVDEVKNEVAKILKTETDEILEVSGKTGEGVRSLLEKMIERVPAPKRKEDKGALRALVFDFTYSNHRGVVLHTRVFDGSVKAKTRLFLNAAGEKFVAAEVGIFSPEEKPVDVLGEGEIGYIVTGIKEPGIASVGDTVFREGVRGKPLPGYEAPTPVVWASVYPENKNDFDELKRALEKVRLSDSALAFEEESSRVLGRGFRCGFLGMLHLEIVTERLRREHNFSIVVTTPSITYEVEYEGGKKEKVYSPVSFPDYGAATSIHEPWVRATIITPNEYISVLTQLLFEHEAKTGESEVFGEGRVSIKVEMPLRELMRGFFDKLKSVSSGYASLSYEVVENREADVVRLDLLVAGEVIPAFSRIVSRVKIQGEAEKAVEELSKALPRQLFVTKIQGRAMGRILSSKTLKALRKDVTGHLYGGDVTRKKKLLEKQKKGKKRLLQKGRVNIPQETFLKMLKVGNQ